MKSTLVAAVVLTFAIVATPASGEEPPAGTWQIVHAGMTATSTASVAWVVNTSTGAARACFISSPDVRGIFCTDWVNIATMPAGVQQ
ncbi:MAG: hypothetical protein ACREEV_19810 [Dongiaceae bacterium]